MPAGNAATGPPGTGSSPPKKENKPTKPTMSTSTSPSAKPGSITSWGSTSGKLYLSSPRLDDPKSMSAATNYFCGADGNGKKEDNSQGGAKDNSAAGG